MTTCCPPNSHKYLASEYVPIGSCHSFSDGTEYYKTGSDSHKKGVLVIPDIFGWNGCRIRNIADQLAEAGYYVIIPKLLIPNFEGGTDGDGLPGDFFEKNGDKFGTYISTITWEGVIKPKVTPVINRMKEIGITKISVLGFCWGGLMVAKIADEFSDIVTCGAIPHPSFQLEDAFYGGSAKKVMSNVKRPLLLLPAGSDSDDLRTGGELFETLKAGNPGSETYSTEFSDMQHGWSLRGDTKDEKIKEKVELAMSLIYAFFDKHNA